jgi:hypothetical protein
LVVAKKIVHFCFSLLTLTMRFFDYVFLVLLCYFCWSCIFIERHYCAEPLSADSEGLMLETFKFSQKYNPLFLARPEWLRVATCGSAYVFLAGYALLFVTFAFQVETLAKLSLLFVGMKLYAIGYYYYFELFSPLATPDLVMFFATDGPYLIALLYIIPRLLQSTVFANNNKQKRS